MDAMNNPIIPTDPPPLLAVRVNDLIGRAKEIEKLIAACKDLHRPASGPRLFYIIGEGGLGKTRLLEDLREHPETYGLEAALCTDVIDLYDPMLHSEAELRARIIGSLNHPGRPMTLVAPKVYGADQAPISQLHTDNAQRADAKDDQNALRESFARELAERSRDNPVVVLLDTVETLAYDRDEVQEDVPPPWPLPGAMDWLKNLITERQAEQRVLFIVAGRPEPVPLQLELRSLADVREAGQDLSERVITLGGLAEDDVAEYFASLRRTLEAHGCPQETLDALAGVTDDERRRLMRIAMGRPVALGLAIHFWLTEQRKSLRVLMADQKRSITELHAQLRQLLVSALVHETFESLTDPFLILALMRQGMSESNLQRLWKEADVADIAAAFGHLEKMSFTKTRFEKRWDSVAKVIEDRKVLFMHDEIADWVEVAYFAEQRRYAHRIRQQLFDRYVEVDKQLAAATVDITARLDATARHELDSGEREPAGAQSPIEPLDGASSQERDQLNSRYDDIRRARNRARFYAMHYGLRCVPEKGYRWYDELSLDAFNSNEQTQDIRIHADFRRWTEAAMQPRTANGLSDWIWSDLAYRWGQRAYLFQQQNRDQSQMALNYIDDLRRKGRERLDVIFDYGLRILTLVILSQSRRLEASMLEGIHFEFAAIEKELSKLVSRELKGGEVDGNSDTSADASLHRFRHVAALSVLGFAHYSWAFVRSQYDELKEAIENCTRSAFLFRKLDYELAQANALNSKAYYLALSGDPQAAMPVAEDARELRQRQGYPLPIAYNRNTRALIKAMANQPQPALALAVEALVTFKWAEDRYGECLARRALSEILRRKGESEEQTAEVTLADRRRACEQSEIAIRLALDTSSGPTRVADCYNEGGAAYRDLGDFFVNNPLPDQQDAPSKYFAQARAYFDAGLDILPRRREFRAARVDIAVNRAYLEFYADRAHPDEAEHWLHKVDEILGLPRDVLWIPRDADSMSQLWWQLPKAEALKIRIAIARAGSHKSVDLDSLLRPSIKLLDYTDHLKGAPRARDRAATAMYEAYRPLGAERLEECYKRAGQLSLELGIEPSGTPGRTPIERYLHSSFGAGWDTASA